jgi:hypothetical protein
LDAVPVVVALVLFEESVAVAANVTVPSAKALRSKVNDQDPSPAAVVVLAIRPDAESVTTMETVVLAGAVPLTVNAALLPLVIWLGKLVNVGAAGLVSLVAVLVAVPLVLPTASLAVAAAVSVPSARPLTSIPVTDHAPPDDAVAVRVTEPPPPLLVTTRVTVLFAGAVPVAATAVALPEFTGLVNVLITGVATAAVPFVAVTVVVLLEVPSAFLAVAAYVTVPSPSELALMPLSDQAPVLDAATDCVRDPPPLLVRTSVTVLLAGAVPAAATAVTFERLIGLVNEENVGAVIGAAAFVAVLVAVALVLPAASLAVAA